MIQKHVIQRAAEWRKPVIIATQMLESMIENPRPTRAEASDVANAIFDGTDAVMLSGETASGRYPREAVAMMVKIVVQAEASMEETEQPKRRRDARVLSIAETICESVAHAAEELHMEAIASFTDTGTTVRLISKYRPKAAIYGFSHSSAVCNRMNLLWGRVSAAASPRANRRSNGKCRGAIARQTRPAKDRRRGRSRWRHENVHGFHKLHAAARDRQRRRKTTRAEKPILKNS